MRQRIGKLLWLSLLSVPLMGFPGCTAPPGNGSVPGDGNGDGDGDGTGGDSSGDYDPATELRLEHGDLMLIVPPGATNATITVTIMSTTNVPDLAPLPGGVGLTGGRFEPSGQEFRLPVQVLARLSAPTIASALPVLFYDDEDKVWVGTGSVAIVGSSGTTAAFGLEHFSTAGVPDPMPLPPTGDAVGSLIGVANLGEFESNEIDSVEASLLFSDSAPSLVINVSERATDSTGQNVTKTLLLSATSVTRVDNFVVAEVGGVGSSFNDGGFRSPNEPLVGATILSVVGDTVHVTVYVASTERVISGTFTGPAS